MTASTAGTALSRLLAVAALLTLIVVPALLPRVAAGEPAATPFLQLHIDSVTPDTVSTTSEPMVTVTGTVTNVGDRPVRDVMVGGQWVIRDGRHPLEEAIAQRYAGALQDLTK